MKKQDINEIKSYANPPETVFKILKAVCTMFGAKQDWKSAKQLLSNPSDFLEQVLSYPKDQISHKLIVKANKQLAGESPEHTRKVSQAAYALHIWVLALSDYFYEIHPNVKREESPAKEEKKPHLEKKPHSPKKEVHHEPQEEHAPSNAMERAAHGIMEMDKKDIQEIKSYATPTATVKTVFSAVCILFKVKQDWKSAQKLMGNPAEFIEQLKNYPKDEVSHKLVVKAKRVLAGESPEHTKKSSKAAYALHNWVLAICEYFYLTHPDVKEEESPEKKPELAKKPHSPKKEAAAPKEEEQHPAVEPSEEMLRAIEALKCMRKDDITMIKSFSTPPQTIVTIMYAVGIMFGMGDKAFVKG